MFGIIRIEFGYHFAIVLIISNWLSCPWVSLSHPEVPARFQSRSRLHFKMTLGALGAPFGKPVWSLWPPQGPKNRKKRRTRGCLFASSISNRVFFTFQVPWTPKNKDSVWDGYTKPHFRPRPKKTRFYTDFVIVLRTIWTMLETFGSPLGLKGTRFSFFSASIFLSVF